MHVAVRSLGVAVLVALASACAVSFDDESDTAQGVSQPCNGHVELCDRSVADVAFPTTHNSFAWSRYFKPGFSNQNRDIAEQLRDGIRGLMLDTYWHQPLFKSARAALCHKNCTLGGYMDLVPELTKVNAFLNQFPREVVLLFVEQHSLTPTQFATAMTSAGLASKVYTHPSPTSPWPTLGQLISNGRRVIVFYETDGAELARPAWYHRLFDEVWQNAYTFTAVNQLTCNRDRGNANAQLYLVNHFLSQPAGWENLARQANPWNVVHDHVSDCEVLQLPNAVAVDFYELDENANDGVYSVVRIADYLNGV